MEQLIAQNLSNVILKQIILKGEHGRGVKGGGGGSRRFDRGELGGE